MCCGPGIGSGEEYLMPPPMEAQLGNPAVDQASNIAIDSLKACDNMFMGRASALHPRSASAPELKRCSHCAGLLCFCEQQPGASYSQRKPAPGR